MPDKKLPDAPHHARHSMLTDASAIENIIVTEGKATRAEIDELKFKATTIEKAGKATFKALKKAQMIAQAASAPRLREEERRGPKF